VLFGAPNSRLQERMRGIVPFEPLLKGMDLSPLVLARAGVALRKHRAQVVLAMMKKDVRHTVPAAWALRLPSVVRYANDRPLTGWIYDRILFGNLPVWHIVNSQATRRTLLNSAPWLKSDAVTVIYNGIDASRFELTEGLNLGLPDDAVAIGFLGRLETRKGLLDLARAWPMMAREVPRAHLVIVGTGAEESEARELLRDVPRVHWLGYRSDIPAILCALDIVAVPSHWEGFGLVAAEAMAAGVPVVAANASSLPEIVTDGVHGRLVPPNNPGALADALIAMVRDPIERRRMGAAGRDRIRKDFTVDRMVDAYEALLLRTVRGTASTVR
jgi:glycosyltransferase involved in cell wall biosynthesis